MLCGSYFFPFPPHLSGGTMATSQTCCHLPGEMLNSAAECADRARMSVKMSDLNDFCKREKVVFCQASMLFSKFRERRQPKRCDRSLLLLDIIESAIVLRSLI
jgi:hypothetical protein